MIFKITIADISQIYLENLGIQLKYDCWILAYWFDQKRKSTFYLIDAPNLESVKEMHCQVYHSYPSQIFQVEEAGIEIFLKSIESPKSPARKFNSQSSFHLHLVSSAVMVMKLNCGPSISLNKNIESNRLFEDFKHCSLKLLRKNKGRIAKSANDDYIYYFDSISQSIKSALQIQQELEIRIKTYGEKSIILSIGIAGGMPMYEDCDPFKKTINLARRLCYIAGTNQIILSSIVKEQFQLKDWGILLENCNLKSLNHREELFLTRLMDTIELNYREDLKIADLCKVMGESRSQLYRKIIEMTHLTPISLINEFRLNRAADLIYMQKGNNISQIAFEAGFNSLSYFSRRYKKRFGHLPKAYMNRR